jgi:hypothetical protein
MLPHVFLSCRPGAIRPGASIVLPLLHSAPSESVGSGPEDSTSQRRPARTGQEDNLIWPKALVIHPQGIRGTDDTSQDELGIAVINRWPELFNRKNFAVADELMAQDCRPIDGLSALS